ncbi:MAG: hypothetical protein ACYC5M_16230 [Anaerolineae bacterium]
MSFETLQVIVGTAIVDSRFCRGLLEKRPDLLNSFDLTDEESEAIASIRAKTIQGFASELQGWISRNENSTLQRCTR